MDKIKIRTLVDNSIKNINEILGNNQKISTDRNNEITGINSRIDSTIFLNLILEIEKKIFESYDIEINILDKLSENLYAKFTLGDLENLIIKMLNDV